MATTNVAAYGPNAMLESIGATPSYYGSRFCFRTCQAVGTQYEIQIKRANELTVQPQTKVTVPASK